jgi:hypothetical protein
MKNFTPMNIHLRRLLPIAGLLVAVAFTSAQDAKMMAQVAPGLDSKLMLIIRNDVAKDLGLTKAQKDTIANDLVSDMKPKGGRPPNFPGMAGIMRDKIRQKLREIESKLVSRLTPDQQKRLGEIQSQVKGELILLDRNIRKKLALSKEQEKQFSPVERNYRKSYDQVKRKAIDEGANPRVPYLAMVQLEKSTNAEIAKILTIDQAKKLDTMFGSKFDAKFGMGTYTDLPSPGGN